MARQRRKLSGPLLDRTDLLVNMHRPSAETLAQDPLGTRSHDIRAAVIDARERQSHRLAGSGLSTNAELTPRLTSTAAHGSARTTSTEALGLRQEDVLDGAIAA
jgi:predicted ATPase with chaperone activity